MGYTIAQKIIKSHLKEGQTLNDDIYSLKVDQTLTQDATGTMAYLQLEALGTDYVKTEKSVAYIDHNTLQSGYMNADDHKFIASFAKKHGIFFSRPGNGICHQIHLERFAKPSKILIGSDSHTPTCGGISMLSFGAGGFDVAVAMAGGRYNINKPKMVKINLHNKLRPFVSAKDIILKVLSILGVKGGVGKIIEYGGDGILSLSVPQRATITNMGAELGATTSIFPSDNNVLEFLKSQNRESDFIELYSDDDAFYDETYDIDLSTLEPLVACPHSPDNVKTVKEIEGIDIDQICIGSCTNSSLMDMKKVAAILEGNNVAEDVSLVISPGSKQVLTMLAKSGDLAKIIDSGARVLESACGPCIGMGQSPKSKGVSLRTFNRNFLGRSGTEDAEVYLVSPETAAFSAINGKLSNPLSLIEKNERLSKVIDEIKIPDEYYINDNMICPPAEYSERDKVEVIKGPNIKSFPIADLLTNELTSNVVLKTGDNITTDHIMPAGFKILPYRSNIPYLSQFCFEIVDKDFPNRCLENKGGVIIGGDNYGQGSSREHAALVPLYLGIKVVIVKSFARIHRANLINVGIWPLTFKNEADYDNVKQGDTLVFENLINSLKNKDNFKVYNKTNNKYFELLNDFSDRDIEILSSGGSLNYFKNKLK